ncbi:MAG: MBL fold metallo-hydrolase, partial [Pseudomonadota bacterium]
MSGEWEVFALRYAERNARTRGDSFIFDDHAGAPHGMDYFLWLLRRGAEVILVDTGYDAAEGARRDRPILRDPGQVLAPFGLTPDEIDTVIVTHL